MIHQLTDEEIDNIDIDSDILTKGQQLSQVAFGEQVIASQTAYLEDPAHKDEDLTELTALRDANVEIVAKHRAYIKKHRSSSSFPFPMDIYQ